MSSPTSSDQSSASPSSTSPASSDPTVAPSTASAEPVSPPPQINFEIGEEYGTARRNLPPAGILVICIAVVALIVAGYSLSHRAHALSSGSIGDIVSVSIPGQNMLMVAVNVSVQNNANNPSWIHTIQASLETAGGKFTDDAAPAVDVQRYFQAFPDLKQHALNLLQTETKLTPENKVLGTVVFSFPVTADAFAARKSLSVTIAPYDEVPVVLTK